MGETFIESKKTYCHFLYVPFTGLGLYNGFRGNRFLRNRIKIFKQFVVPSLQNQTCKNFTLWISWRREEKTNPDVQELVDYLAKISEFKTVHTYHGICFWDDKYPDDAAHDRLITSLHDTMGELVNEVGDADEVLVTIQPSDDLYHRDAVKEIQNQTWTQAFGFKRGYIINYQTLEAADYNPDTNPPFFTIRFTKEIFIDPLKHAKYTGPYKSHEYVKDYLDYTTTEKRGFMVGIHGENISTVWNHPFKGAVVPKETLKDFGIFDVSKLKIKYSLRKKILRMLPHMVQRKLRYIFGEKWQKIYEYLRS